MAHEVLVHVISYPLSTLILLMAVIISNSRSEVNDRKSQVTVTMS